MLKGHENIKQRLNIVLPEERAKKIVKAEKKKDEYDDHDELVHILNKTTNIANTQIFL